MDIIFGHQETSDTKVDSLHAKSVVIERLLNQAAIGEDFEKSFGTALWMVLDIDRDILRGTLDTDPCGLLGLLSWIKVRSLENLQEYPPARFAAGIDAVVAAVKRWPKRRHATAETRDTESLALFHTEFEAFVAQRQKQARQRCAYKPGAYRRREAVIASIRLVPQQDIFG